MLTRFNESNDIVTSRIDGANAQFNISTSANAAGSAFWAFVCNSTTGGYLFKPDTTSLSASNISSSAAFRHLANYFFGTNTYIYDSYDKTIQRTTVRCIQIGRPLLDEGIYPNTITAVLSATNFVLSAHDVQNIASLNSSIGLSGVMVNNANATDVVGTIFYDHGVIVFHGGIGATGTIMCSSSSGMAISAGYAANYVSLISCLGQTRNIVKRTIYFTRAFNKDYNFTTNPTARDAQGFLVGSLTANPTTFITTVGLYDDAGNMLAVGKINPPKRKDSYAEALFKVQLDYVWAGVLIGSSVYLSLIKGLTHLLC